MRCLIPSLLALSILLTGATSELLARGGLRGGGRFGGGGISRGGFSGRGMPSRSISRGSIQSRMPSRSIPSRGTLNRSPSITPPRTGSTRIGSGSVRSGATGSGSRIGSSGAGSNRTGVTLRPGIGSGSLQPGSRTPIGSGNRVGSGTGAGSSPFGSRTIGTGQFPGLGSRSTAGLPGLGNGNAGQNLQQRFPDLNRDTLRQQIGMVGDTGAVTRDKFEAWRQQRGTERARIPERRQDLQDRFSGIDRERWQERRGENIDNRQEFREGRQEDWQQHREGAREDWQSYYDDHYYYHYGWHNGGWHYGWDNYWQHMWDEHPAAVAFGLTCWGINTAGYLFGMAAYSNPYYVESSGSIDYSEPQIVVQQTVTDGGNSEPPAVPEDGLTAFEQARAAFHTGKYQEARQLADEALKSMPRDAVVHEFRALVLFAEGDYTGAAAVLHTVLAVGPGWDWTTMSQLYPSIDAYTTQLRALEEWTKKRSSLPDGHFVLAYHYLTCGHNDAAAEQLRIVIKTLPDDSVSARLLNQLTGEAPKATASADSAPSTVAIKSEDIVGEWKATAEGSVFQLELKKDGRFRWSFTADGQSQGIGGVYAIDASTLALETDSGGVMLAEIRLAESHMTFQQVGADSGAARLKFSRQ